MDSEIQNTPIKDKLRQRPPPPLIDSAATPKSYTKYIRRLIHTPIEIRMANSVKNQGLPLTEIDTSTDDEYFVEPQDPRVIKRHRNKKNLETPPVAKRTGSRSSSAKEGSAKKSSSNSSLTPTQGTSKTGLDVDSINQIAEMFNNQSAKLSNEIKESRDTVVSTMEEKMDRIIQESERRIHDRISEVEKTTMDCYSALESRLQILEGKPNSSMANIDQLSVINNQMDIITNRLDTNLSLIRENSERIAQQSTTLSHGCQNGERLTTCENKIDQLGQDHKNFSLIFSGLRPDYQNGYGIVGFCREILGLAVDPAEVSDVIKLGVNKLGYTITKVIFYSVSSRRRVYQARASLRGSMQGIFVNEDLTKERERLSYMARLLFKNKAVAKNWTFLGEVYVKKTLEGEITKITKKEDLIPFDVNNILREMNLL